jgi:hypothetical protein
MLRADEAENRETMLKTAETGTHWTPTSQKDREVVAQELEAILANPHFRGSKRYPALLKFVVDATVQGRTDDLKERTLGVEVFGRNPDYDTNADPVVRFSASEVRERLAQYYHEQGDRPRLQIELPLGSYVPQLFLRSDDTAAEETLPPLRAADLKPAPSRGMHRVVLGVIAAFLLLAAGVFAAYSYHSRPSSNAPVPDALWGPILAAPGQVLMVVGTSHPGKVAMVTDRTSFNDFMTGPYHHVSVASAVALAHLAAVLRLHGNLYEVKEDNETSLTDLRARPVILIGATNNLWTMRLVSELRYRFIRNGTVVQIVDSQTPANTQWSIDFSKPHSAVHTDYALVARFRDSITEGPVMVIAGLGTYGTQAASEFASSPRYLALIQQQMQKTGTAGWQNQNVEFVL